MTALHHYGDAVIFLMASIAVVLLFKRMRLSPVLGYLLVGMVIGPYGISLINGLEQTKELATLGVIFLMFIIGLDLSLSRLKTMRTYVFGVGGAQVLVTTAVITLCGQLLGLNLSTAVIVGCGLALSSTAFVMELLAQDKELTSRHGRLNFAILLFQDISVVFILMLATLLDREHATVSELISVLGFTILKGAGILLVLWIVGKYVLKPLCRLVAFSNDTDIFMAMSLLLVLFTSVVTELAGLSMTLGAFLAGLLLAETEFRPQIEADIQPFKSILLGIFFMTVGMSMDYTLLWHQLPLIMGISLGLVLVKSLLMFGVAQAFKVPLKTAIRTSLFLAGGGEFAFVIFGPGVSDHLIPPALERQLFLAVGLSMALTPFLASLGRYVSQYVKEEVKDHLQAVSRETQDLREHILIVGFGRVGQTVAQMISGHMIPYIGIDISMRNVSVGRKRGMSVFFGDARRTEVIRAMGAEKAKAALVTINHIGSSTRVVALLQRYFPHLKIFVRVKDEEQASKLREVGAYPIVPETYAPSMQLAATVLAMSGVPQEKITRMAAEFYKGYPLVVETSPRQSSLPFVDTIFHPSSKRRLEPEKLEEEKEVVEFVDSEQG